MVEKIGFIGLGTMGRPMAKNLIEAGYEVKAYDIDERKQEALIKEGAAGCKGLAEVSENVDLIITVLPDTKAVKEVVMGEDGLLENLEAGAILMDMSTIEVQTTQIISKKLAARNIGFFDAPVSGGEIGAVEGELSIMAGGDRDRFSKVKPVMEVLGERINYMGEAGMGQMTKLCNQVIGSLTLQAVCEGLMLGAKGGLDLEKLVNVISGGVGDSWMLENFAPKIIEGDYEPGFRIKLNLKDLNLVLESARNQKLSLPATALLYQHFQAVEAHGDGDLGNQALIKYLEYLSDFKFNDSS